jgi:hypothetical protein
LQTELGVRLSLYQRERIKVRDCLTAVGLLQTRLLVTRCRVLGEPGDSRIATQRFHAEPGILSAFDREFGVPDSYVRRRPIRQPALRWDNRNPGRNRLTDFGGEICSLRNFGSVSVARESVQAQSPSFPTIERDSQRFILTIKRIFRKEFPDAPHLNPLPASGARRTRMRF